MTMEALWPVASVCPADAEARSPWMRSSCIHSQGCAAVLGPGTQQQARQTEIP